MKIALITDLHANREAVEAVLAHAQSQSVARYAFLGDFVGYGADPGWVVDTVREFVAQGAAAVMGNHEFNAIAWHTRHPRRRRGYLRAHDGERGEGNRKQHAAFLGEVERKPNLHKDIIDWFLRLPLWLDLPGLHVVHACWHPAVIGWLEPRLHRGRYLTRSLMVRATREPSDEAKKDDASRSMFKAVEYLIKGIEVPLPAGHSFLDKYGIERHRVRVRWWDECATTFSAAAMLPLEQRRMLPEFALPAHARVARAAKPVFFGHYWLTGTPSVQSTRSVCVDYSAGTGGPLVAYRFDSEPELTPDHLVWVD